MNDSDYLGQGTGCGMSLDANMHQASSEWSNNTNRRSRKPYTISKPRQSWSETEHMAFVRALELYKRDWPRIKEHIGTKSVVQIRSHAQKYFLKLQRQGRTDMIPKARPKKKSKFPYPKYQKESSDCDGIENNRQYYVSFRVTGIPIFLQ